MDIIKQIVLYYCTITGKQWHEFFTNLDTATAMKDSEEISDEFWLINKLVDTANKNEITLDMIKTNKDAVKAVFDNDGRKQAGEFFTPEIWCKEGRTYFDKHISNWHEYNIWDISAGTGNLLRTANHPVDKLFLSTLQEDDVKVLENTPEYKGATIFQLDFLADLDYDIYNTDFLDKLPERLQQIIRNNEPLLIYANPPYKAGTNKGTDVGRHMCTIGLNRPAYDIFYQFVWRVMNFVKLFEMNNIYLGVFGPLTFFTGSSANILLREFERCFEFVDGMCISAQEFSDTSDDIIWGIGCSLWKSRGYYHHDDYRRDVVLDKKFKISETEVGVSGKVIYAPPREKLSDWVVAKDIEFYIPAPVMTSHITFKGSDVGVRIAHQTMRIAENALGTLMTGNTLTRSSDKSAILSEPTTIQYCDITEENFWRCVASFSYRRIVNPSWAITKKDISAPVTTVEGYHEWLMNSLVIFLFEWKSMMSSIRDVQWDGTLYNIRNKLFYLSAEDVKAHCHDEKILEDIEKNPQVNDFMLKAIEQAKPYWHPDVKQLFDFCVEYTYFSFDYRSQTNYEGCTDAWDAGFAQIKAGMWNNELQNELQTRINLAEEYLRKDLDRFGFVEEELSTDEL